MFGLFLVFCALFLFLALLSFYAGDPSLNYVKSGVTEAHNKAGLFGAYIAGLLNDHFGIGSLIWPCVFFALAAAHISPGIILHWWRWAGFFLLTLFFLVISSALDLSIGDLAGGGMLGNTLHACSVRYLSPAGSFLLWAFVAFAGIQLVANFSWITFCQNLLARFLNWRANRRLAAPVFASSSPSSGLPASASMVSAVVRTRSFFQNSSSTLKKLLVSLLQKKPPMPALHLATSQNIGAMNAPVQLAPGTANQTTWLQTTELPGAAAQATVSQANAAQPEASFQPAFATGAQPPFLPYAFDDDEDDPFAPSQELRPQPETAVPVPPVQVLQQAATAAAQRVPVQEPVSAPQLVPTQQFAPENDPAGSVQIANSSLAPGAGTIRTNVEEQENADQQPEVEGDVERGAGETIVIIDPAVAGQTDAQLAMVQPQGEGAAASAAFGPAVPAANAETEFAQVEAPRTGNQEPDKKPSVLMQIFQGLTGICQASGEGGESAQTDPQPAALLPVRDARLFTKPEEIVFPSPELLYPAKPMPAATPDDLRAKGEALMQCFSEFDVAGELAGITPGPVVTMFEMRPAPGIRVSKIANLADDLSRSLKAVAVRIQAPIPGSDTVGIEIPNEMRETVNFRELVESPEFTQDKGPLTMILGKTIAGETFMADLTRMPHMLGAGATGAGKSVRLNSILVSLLFRMAPAKMRLLLVDPKRIELAVYADLPHLVHPVVTEMDDAKNALDWAVQDMKNRYKTFERMGVRNIVAYHQKLESFGGTPPPGLEDMVPLPYMVIVIDELADLMMTAAREVETSIVRLAQLARAAGIHMILATQRPSVDVVTGLIKANFPCRISFQVTSKHDSRTILDQVGAEHLLGRGDMLFKPSGGKLQRLHGPFLTDEEVQAVANHWKAQLPPEYSVDFSQWSAEVAQASPAVGGDATTDALYNEARDFVLDQGRASISLLQRHLKIGFNRAARLMEQFERDGIIGPADGSKPRNVIR